MFIITAVTVVATPSVAQRSSEAITVRQLPAPRTTSCSCSVGKSRENSTLWNRLTSASDNTAMLRPFEVIVVLTSSDQR